MEGQDLMNDYLTTIGLNTLYGFQYSEGVKVEHCVLCWCDSDMKNETFQKIKELSGAQSLYLGDLIVF